MTLWVKTPAVHVRRPEFGPVTMKPVMAISTLSSSAENGGGVETDDPWGMLANLSSWDWEILPQNVIGEGQRMALDAEATVKFDLTEQSQSHEQSQQEDGAIKALS